MTLVTTTQKRAKASELLTLIEKRKELKKELYNTHNQMWELTKQLRTTFSSKKHYELFKLRYIENASLEDVGRVFGVTRERVRQIEEKVLEELCVIAF